MPHTARITPGDYAYHVLNRRAGRTALFNDEGDHLAFVSVLGQGLERHPGCCDWDFIPSYSIFRKVK